MEVGNTPLVKLDGIYAKPECVNPTGLKAGKSLPRALQLDITTELSRDLSTCTTRAKK